jgi:beta-glucosidase
MPVNFAASFNRTAIETASGVVAREARACGIDRGFSPELNLYADARFGRQAESYSEDPYLSKIMASHALRGLQGGTGGPTTYLPRTNTSIIAVVKHFAGYGRGPTDGNPTAVSEQVLREIYLAPWEYLKASGLRSVMAGQNMVNGRPMHSNRRLLTRVLRDQWGIKDCLVCSDGGNMVASLYFGFHTATSVSDAGVQAVEAGVDIDLGGRSMSTLAVSVAANLTDVKHVDRAARTVLVSKFAAGLFDAPMTDPRTMASLLDTNAHRELSLQVAQQGIILLQNAVDRSTGVPSLPLTPERLKTVQRIALVGPLQDDPVNQQGPYANQNTVGGGVWANIVTVAVAASAALKRLPHVKLVRALGADAANSDPDVQNPKVDEAVALAVDSDLTIAVLGDTNETCGEMFDRSSLELPGGQPALLRALVAAHQNTTKPLIVVLIHGRAITFDDSTLEGIDALLAAWRPGEEGGTAIWQIITGAISPSAKLTQAWPRSVGAIGGPGTPYLYAFQGNHQWENYCDPASGSFVPYHPEPIPQGKIKGAGCGSSLPRFGFGFGLSFTSFSIAPVLVSPLEGTVDSFFNVSTKVTNTGSFAAATVIQLFCRDPFARVVRIAALQLCGFERTDVLVPGECTGVTISLAGADLAYYDDGENDNGYKPGWAVDAGAFDLFVTEAGFGAPGSWTFLERHAQLSRVMMLKHDDDLIEPQGALLDVNLAASVVAEIYASRRVGSAPTAARPIHARVILRAPSDFGSHSCREWKPSVVKN